MCKFTLFSAKDSPWQLETVSKWGSHDFCPAVTNFCMWEITQAQLNTFSQVAAWGNAKKPWQDRAFLLFAPVTAAGPNIAFGLVAVWAHLHQAHYPTLAEAACQLVLLTDGSVDWVYAFVHLNEATFYAPLSDIGHISTMIDGALSSEPHGCLHQLQVWQLLQHKEPVVYPEGLHSKIEASQYTFPDLPLWDVVAQWEPTQSPQQIEVDLSKVQPVNMVTTIQAAVLTPALLPPQRTPRSPLGITNYKLFIYITE